MKKFRLFKRSTALLIAVLMLMCIVFTSCSKPAGTSGTLDKVVWYIPGLLQGNNVEKVMQEVNDLLASRYNLELELHGPGGDGFSTKVQLMNSSHEEYDLAFTSTWTNNYVTGTSNGVFADITDLLPEYAPTLWEDTEDYVWDALKIDGRIYAVPNWQVMARAVALAIPASKLEKTGFTMDDFNTFEDLTPYLEKLHELEPKSNRTASDVWQTLAVSYGILSLIGDKVPGAIYVDEVGKPVVFNQFESEEFKKYVELRRDWVEKGCIIDVYAPDYDGGIKERQEMPFSIMVNKPGVESDFERSLGYDFEFKQLGSGVLSTTGIMAAMTGVSATSKNPENALRMLEVMHTDKEIFNLICWGIEGENYEKISENRIELIKNSGYQKVSAWTLGTQKNSFVSGTQADDVWEQTEVFNNTATVSPLLGFSFNADKVGIEITNCQNVINEQLEFLDLGLVEEKDYEKFVKELKKGGADTIINELQTQVDEWWAKQNK